MHAGGRRSAAAGKASTSRFAIQCNLEPQDEGDGGSVAAPGSGRPETLTAGSAEWHALGELEYPIRLAIAECREETSHMDLAVCAMLKNMANSTAYTQWFRFQRRSDGVMCAGRAPADGDQQPRPAPAALCQQARHLDRVSAQRRHGGEELQPAGLWVTSSMIPQLAALVSKREVCRAIWNPHFCELIGRHSSATRTSGFRP